MKEASHEGRWRQLWNGFRQRKAAIVRFVALATGYTVLCGALFDWRGERFGLFVGYLLIATAAAGLRIRIPDREGGTPVTLSLHFFFVLICVSRLTHSESVLIASAGALIQGWIWGDRVGRWRRIAMDVAVTANATLACAAVYSRLVADEGSAGSPVLLVLASMAYYMTVTLPQCLLESQQDRVSFLQTWRNRHAWALTHYAAGGAAAGLLSMLRTDVGWQTLLLLIPLVFGTYQSYRYHLRLLEAERKQVRETGDLHFRTIEALALAMEGYDSTKHGHLRRVSLYVREVGRELGLTETELQGLHAAAMLHDIGKLAVPEHIITKPGKLTDVEFERVKIHPLAGAELLEQVRFPYPVAPIVRAHHEKWDGTGYPLGLRGNDIPLGARILAAVDCLDALLSDRYHRRALSLDKSIEYIVSQSGKSFDPAVVEILAKRYQDLEWRLQTELLSRSATSRNAASESKDSSAENTPHRVLIGTGFLSLIADARREQQALFRLSRELGNSLSLDHTLSVCASHLQSLCPSDSIAIFIQREGILSADYASGDESWLIGTLEIPVGKGLAGWVAENRTPVLNGNPSEDFTLRGGGVATGLQSALVMQLETMTGVVGVIALYSRAVSAFTVDHLRILSAVAAKASPAIENALRFSQAERSATTDMMTSLPNARSLFQHLDQELARAKRHKGAVAVLVGDLNGFKQINDKFGHLEGNRILRLTAMALKNQCRDYDFVARMGGDEFVIVFSGYRPSLVDSKIEQLKAAVAKVGQEAAPGGRGGAIPLGISIGYATYPDDGYDAESLLAEADRRMYQEKLARSTRPASLYELSLAAGKYVAPPNLKPAER